MLASQISLEKTPVYSSEKDEPEIEEIEEIKKQEGEEEEIMTKEEQQNIKVEATLLCSQLLESGCDADEYAKQLTQNQLEPPIPPENLAPNSFDSVQSFRAGSSSGSIKTLPAIPQKKSNRFAVELVSSALFLLFASLTTLTAALIVGYFGIAVSLPGLMVLSLGASVLLSATVLFSLRAFGSSFSGRILALVASTIATAGLGALLTATLAYFLLPALAMVVAASVGAAVFGSVFFALNSLGQLKNAKLWTRIAGAFTTSVAFIAAGSTIGMTLGFVLGGFFPIVGNLLGAIAGAGAGLFLTAAPTVLAALELAFYKLFSQKSYLRKNANLGYFILSLAVIVITVISSAFFLSLPLATVAVALTLGTIAATFVASVLFVHFSNDKPTSNRVTNLAIGAAGTLLFSLIAGFTLGVTGALLLSGIGSVVVAGVAFSSMGAMTALGTGSGAAVSVVLTTTSVMRTLFKSAGKNTEQTEALAEATTAIRKKRCGCGFFSDAIAKKSDDVKPVSAPDSPNLPR